MMKAPSVPDGAFLVQGVQKWGPPDREGLTVDCLFGQDVQADTEAGDLVSVPVAW
jgi:hypothetical protein